MKRLMFGSVFVFCLALGTTAVGCCSDPHATEGDKQLVSLDLQRVIEVHDRLGELMDTALPEAVLNLVTWARSWLEIVIANEMQLTENFGKPKQEVKPDAEGKEDAKRRDDSKQQHAEVPWYMKVLGILTTVATGYGVGAGIYNIPIVGTLAARIPYVGPLLNTIFGGPFKKVAEEIAAGVTKLRAQAKVAPTITEAQIKTTMANEQSSGFIEGLTVSMIKKVESKLGVTDQ